MVSQACVLTILLPISAKEQAFNMVINISCVHLDKQAALLEGSG